MTENDCFSGSECFWCEKPIGDERYFFSPDGPLLHLACHDVASTEGYIMRGIFCGPTPKPCASIQAEIDERKREREQQKCPECDGTGKRRNP